MLVWKDITQPNKKHPEDAVPLYEGYLGEVPVATVQGPIWNRRKDGSRYLEKPGYRGFAHLLWREAKTQDFVLDEDPEQAKEWCCTQVSQLMARFGVLEIAAAVSK